MVLPQAAPLNPHPEQPAGPSYNQADQTDRLNQDSAAVFCPTSNSTSGQPTCNAWHSTGEVNRGARQPGFKSLLRDRCQIGANSPSSLCLGFFILTVGPFPLVATGVPGADPEQLGVVPGTQEGQVKVSPPLSCSR